jgi:hypothetical protein
MIDDAIDQRDFFCKYSTFSGPGAGRLLNNKPGGELTKIFPLHSHRGYVVGRERKCATVHVR